MSEKKITKTPPPEPIYPVESMEKGDCLEITVGRADELRAVRNRVWAYKDHLIKTGKILPYAKFKSKINRINKTVYLWRIL